MQEKIDHYVIIKSLGKGGMGEVLLVRDTLCNRLVALKRIREDLRHNQSLLADFLQEAHIAARLTHPSIIPIYEIHEEKEKSYYTMPYVEGDTLKQILRSAKEEHAQPSIASLMRVFWAVCQAIAYTHAKGFLHRDIKPENIIVGKYGEVLLLDWGLADAIDHPTHPKRVPGTLAYMAPERAFGEQASVQSDIYSLGVILYYLLTLRLPFVRSTLQRFRKMASHERLLDLQEAAPYRQIPLQLSDVVKCCLAPKESRYATVDLLLADLQSYMEGRPKWMQVADLQLDRKEDWDFQEHVVLAKQIAITRQTDLAEWVSLMVSKATFSGNSKIETRVRFKASGEGIGILFGLSSTRLHNGLEDGYCFWIGSHLDPTCKLFRSQIEVMQADTEETKERGWHRVRIEQTGNHIRCFLDEKLKLDYLSYIPTAAAHVGFLYRDADFEIEELRISVGSQNMLVSCLAVPDAFLICKEYGRALTEYRRIGYSFPGRAEGQEALFRAGLTLLEEARAHPKKKPLLSSALEEFGALHATPGAPLEYLGKSLVYRAQKETAEEIKCLDLALRKYPKHPLLPMVAQQVLFRLHEASSYDRIAAYHFALLTLQHFPDTFQGVERRRLLENLQKHIAPLPFFARDVDPAIAFAFYLGKPTALLERLDKNGVQEDALYALLFLGLPHLVKRDALSPSLEIALLASEGDFTPAMKTWKELDLPTQIYLLETAIDCENLEWVLSLKLPRAQIHYQIWALLLSRKWREAGRLLDTFSLEERTDESSPLYFLFGCWLWAVDGEEAAKRFFSAAVETSYPRLFSLLGHFLLGKIDARSALLFWERVQLLRQLFLFYRCTEQVKMENRVLKELKKEMTYVAKESPST